MGRSGAACACVVLLLAMRVAAQPVLPAIELPPMEVIGVAPLIGSGVDRATVPAQTHVLDRQDIERAGGSLTNALSQQIGGVDLSDASGNPFQPTLFYRGFAASPLQGTPQGLAVYVDGVRFNQPFGDTIDWDLIPDIAIDKVNVSGSNPVFGLNALGGAVNVRLRNGFVWQGLEAAIAGGSFGQMQGAFQYGRKAGDTATYVAGTVRHQNGWRDQQSSDLQNVFGDVGWRGDTGELHLNVTAARSVLNGPGASPVELLAADRRAQFTAPNRISNDYAVVSLTGNADVGGETSVQGVVYYRYFRQRVTNGNAPNDTPCDDGSGLLCYDAEYSTTTGGAFIPDRLAGGHYGQLDNQTTTTNAYGVSAQVSNSDRLLGFRNHVVAGVSFDGARTLFSAASYIGGLTVGDRTFTGPGVLIDEPGVNVPVRVAVSNAYYGLYATDTLNLTADWAVTLSGRFNIARVVLDDRNGGDLTGRHGYDHFNPAAGVTYRVAPWLTAYAGYAVANRAPTPAELSCAGPQNACSLANFFVGDPDLRQVVSHTVEAGLRGDATAANGLKIGYGLGFFRSVLDDDVAFINSPSQGRAYFANVGQTRRQGMDASVTMRAARWRVWLGYTHIDATFQTGFLESAGNNPAGNGGLLAVRPGNRLPGIPADVVKLGGSYRVTDRWTIGASGIAAAGSFLLGDEANLNPKLPGYVTLNLTTSYALTDNVELFAWAENVTNAHYYTFGTFSPTASVALAQAPGATNPRSLSPAAPAGGFAGLRVTF